MKVLPFDDKGSSCGVFLCAVKYILYPSEEGQERSLIVSQMTLTIEAAVSPRFLATVGKTLSTGDEVLLLGATLEVTRFLIFLLSPSSGSRGQPLSCQQSRHFPSPFFDSFLSDHRFFGGWGGGVVFVFLSDCCLKYLVVSVSVKLACYFNLLEL